MASALQNRKARRMKRKAKPNRSKSAKKRVAMKVRRARVAKANRSRRMHRKHAKRNVSALQNRRKAARRPHRKARKAHRNVSALMNGRKHRKARRNVSALMNGRKHHRKARRNVSALMNGRKHHRKAARRNPIMRMRRNPGMRAMGAVKSYTKQVLPWVVGAAGGFAAHMAVEQMGLTKQIEKLALKIPTAGRYIASASHTIQGAAAAAALGMIAKAVGGKAAPYIKDTAISALVIGVVYDAQRIMKAKKDNNGQWALPADLGDLAFGDLAFGDLAFGDLAFGDLGFNKAMSGYGDGMAYETAPLTADYSQASLGDAAYCGADFSAAEGQALINGRGHYMHHYGTPPHRMQNNPKGASHLAGREGHRWGWLMKMVGWEKAQQIAALPPESRIKVLHKLRAAALDAFQREMQVYEAAQAAREIPEQLSDLVPSANGAMGAQGAGELGDGALFMGA